MSKGAIQTVGFVTLVIATTGVFVWLLLPFYGAILWSVVLAILFNPWNRRLTVWFGGRRSLAAAFSVLTCIGVVLVPAAVILFSLSAELAGVYRRAGESEFSLSRFVEAMERAMPDFARSALEGLDLGSLDQMQESSLALLSSAGQTLATGALDVGQSAAQLLISLAIMLYLLFFLFRDGSTLAPMIRNAIPIERSRTDHIARKFVSVAKATVRGNILIAIIQGALGGVTLWLLGMEAPLLWGVVMAVLSLLPALGAFLVWGPLAVYLFLTGDYVRGIILLLVGGLIISMIDNLLRPVLVGRETKLPDYVVLISTLGGLSVFGMNGFVLGPLIAALFIAVWSQFTDDRLKPEVHGPVLPK